MAGIAGSATYGVAKNCNLITVKVVGRNLGLVSKVIKGIEWVVTQHTANDRPSVLNLSLEAGFHNALNLAVNNCVDAGVVVTAAGNGYGADACIRSPASAAKAITVGATERTDDARSSFSNIGPCVDIFTGGGAILSTGHTDDEATSQRPGELSWLCC